MAHWLDEATPVAGPTPGATPTAKGPSWLDEAVPVESSARKQRGAGIADEGSSNFGIDPERPFGSFTDAARKVGETVADTVHGAAGLLQEATSPALAAAGAAGSYLVPGEQSGSFGDRWRANMSGIRATRELSQRRSPNAYAAGAMLPMLLAPEASALGLPSASGAIPATQAAANVGARALGGVLDAAAYNAGTAALGNTDRDPLGSGGAAAMSPLNLAGAVLPIAGAAIPQTQQSIRQGAASLARRLTPQVKPTPAAQSLIDNGVSGLTLGQMAPDSPAGHVEEASADRFLGMAPERRAAANSWRQAVLAKGLPPGMKQVPEGPIQDQLSSIYEGFGPAYDKIRAEKVYPAIHASPSEGDSASGLKLYHGTNAPEFSAVNGPSYWTDDPAMAAGYAGKRGRVIQGEVTPGKAAIVNSMDDIRKVVGGVAGKYQRPFEALDDPAVRRSFQDKGYDAVRFEDVADGSAGETTHNAWLVLDPARVRLGGRGLPLQGTTNTPGAFDLAVNDPNILADDQARNVVKRFLDNQLSLLPGNTTRPGMVEPVDAGALLKMRENIRKAGHSSMKAGKEDQSQLLENAEQAVTDALGSQLSPEARQHLADTDRQYAIYKAIESASARQIAPGQEGQFTPAQLAMELRARAGKPAFARGGGGDLRALAQSGNEVFGMREPKTGGRAVILDQLPGQKYIPGGLLSRVANAPEMKAVLLRQSSPPPMPLSSVPTPWAPGALFPATATDRLVGPVPRPAYRLRLSLTPAAAEEEQRP